MKHISPEDLKPLLTDGDEIAFLDVREHGQYGEGHPFFSVPAPYSRIEAVAESLLPRKSVRLVLMDDGDGVADRAAMRMADAGFTDISILEGGAPAWSDAGYTLFKGVNVPSKTFGELLEHAAATPSLTANELATLQDDDPSVVVLDGRSPAEYRKMSLPGALCCPNAELGYRLRRLVPDESTTVVINCAGRTRSILGVEGLRLLGIRNPLFALENGTQGWRLAGFDLDHGTEPQPLPEPSAEDLHKLANIARSIISTHTLETITPETLADWQGDDTRSTYLLDVRTDREYAQGHWPGARHAPGGQLVQATDQYVAVRYARLVLSDDNRLRAAATAVRLRQMGHLVYLLDADASQGEARPDSDGKETRSLPELAEQFGRSALGVDAILDASGGMEYRDAHIRGAHWVTRARLDNIDYPHDARLLVTGRESAAVQGVVADLATAGYTQLDSCVGSPAIWSGAGFDLDSTPDSPSDEACIDYLFFVHDRHDGNLDAARRYLEWEVGLVGQLDQQERSVLNPQAPLAADVHE